MEMNKDSLFTQLVSITKNLFYLHCIRGTIHCGMVNVQAFHVDFTRSQLQYCSIPGGFEDKLVKPAPLLTYNCNRRRVYRIPDFKVKDTDCVKN